MKPKRPDRVPPSRQRGQSRSIPRLRVSVLPGERFRARVLAGTSVIPCVIGPAGVTRQKREGDGATPAGRFGLSRVLYRPDRGPPPRSGLPRQRLTPKHGWCDDPKRMCYNQPVALPFAASHERMWRDDALYDAVVVVDYNLRPARKGRGSAIFLHVQKSPAHPTAGCVAMEGRALRRLLARVGPRTRIEIV